MSGVRILHFLKDWWKFIQIHQYYNTMALRYVKQKSNEKWTQNFPLSGLDILLILI